MADIFSKIIKDYNIELEKILEKKDFDEEVKNLLLSMLYKIENGYDDYKKVKVNVCSKADFINEILKTIEKKCKQIKLVKPTSNEGIRLIDEGINCIVDKEKGIIESFQNENSLLDAIIQIRQEDLNVNEQYETTSLAIREMLLLGENMNSLEILTDFNGWSWDITVRGKKNTTYNNLYQLLLILLGNEEIDNLAKQRKNKGIDELPNNLILRSKYNDSYGIDEDELIMEEKDYVAQLRQKFKKVYGEELEKEFFKVFIELAILEYSKKDEDYRNKVIERQNSLSEKIKQMNDNKKFIEDLSKQKKEITKQIEEIDKLLSNEKTLKNEYDKRNENLPDDKKIFSVSHFRLMLNKDRKNKMAKIKDINKLMEPVEFVKRKNDLIDTHKFYEDIDITDTSQENTNRLQGELEKIFLNCFDKKIDLAEENSQIEDLIYELRYYKQIPAMVLTREWIVELIQEKLIKKACGRKILTQFSEDEETNNLILKEIFNTRIIELNTMVFVLKFSKGILSIHILDANTDDETKQVELTKKTELCVKLNKKIKVWQ